MQGEHQVAQQSSNTTLPWKSLASIFFPSIVVSEKRHTDPISGGGSTSIPAFLARSNASAATAFLPLGGRISNPRYVALAAASSLGSKRKRIKWVLWWPPPPAFLSGYRLPA